MPTFIIDVRRPHYPGHKGSDESVHNCYIVTRCTPQQAADLEDLIAEHASPSHEVLVFATAKFDPVQSSEAT